MRPTLARAYSGSRKARIGADETENRFATPLDERFDLVYCFGILHRVENPLGLLRVLRGRTASGGSMLVETYGVRAEDRDGPAIRVSDPGEVYARATSSSTGGSGTPASSGLPGSQASRAPSRS